MEEKKQGGKRNGAGRKRMPILEKKSTVILYVPNANILKFGGKDKMTNKINDFISEFGTETKIVAMPLPDAYDAPKMPFTMNDEPKMFKEPILNQFEAYKTEIGQTTWSGDLAALMKIIKADTGISAKQYGLFEVIANEHAKDFTN